MKVSLFHLGRLSMPTKSAVRGIGHSAGIMLVAVLLASATHYLHRPVIQAIAWLKNELSPTSITLCSHNIYNNALRSALKQDALSYLAKKTVVSTQPGELADQLCERYTIIESVSFSMKRPKQAEMHLYGTQPQWRLNEHLVIGANAKIYPQTYFARFPLSSLPRVVMPEQDVHTTCCDKNTFDLLGQLPSVITSQFDIHWLNAQTFELHAPSGGLVVRARRENLFDTKKLAAVTKLYGALDATTRAKEQWEYDLRFEGQVISHKKNKRGGS